jgi:hypothetical protein
MKALRALGMDGAVTFTFLAKSVSIAGSVGTVLLIVRFLTPIEQGYYYTLLSLVSLQIVFELGFSVVVLQLAAHEAVHLTISSQGEVRGDAAAHARLASALRLSAGWYTWAAAAMTVLLAPLGIFFFSRHAGQNQVAWQGPWLTAVIASSISLLCTPLYAFLEGCGQVRAVAAMRLRQAAASAVLGWAALILGHGLYSPALVVAGYFAVGLLFVGRHRRLLSGLMRHRTACASIEWQREVWPFQWRIAISSMCSYFTVQVFIPILFALRGPVEAGQLGMSLSIAGYLTTLALAWTSTKSAAFGNMIARRAFGELDRLFRRTWTQSLAVFTAFAAAACTGSVLLPWVAPRLAARLVSPAAFAVLAAAAGANCAIQGMATFLRSFKSEPFLAQSLTAAAASLLLIALTAPEWGNAGAALSYMAATAGLALPWSLSVFVRARRGYLTARLPICPNLAPEGGSRS